MRPATCPAPQGACWPLRSQECGLAPPIRLAVPRHSRPRMACRASSDAAAGSSPLREVLDARQRSKLDGGDDRDFYASPRMVHHLDAGFRAQLTQLYRQRVPEGGAVLDLCSSWVSHLPPEARYSRVVGHGLNAAELAANRRLDEFVVRNLNRSPRGWAFARDASFDAVLCVASVQYLQQPEAVWAEVARVLRPGGVFIVAFSNRMFASKAIAAWRDNSDYGRCLLVKSYFAAAGGFTDPEVVTRVQLPQAGQPGGGPLQQLRLWAEQMWQGGGGGDPFFAVLAHKE